MKSRWSREGGRAGGWEKEEGVEKEEVVQKEEGVEKEEVVISVGQKTRALASPPCLLPCA